ncbi:glycosyl hydrolase [Flexithrix dorotheae]|uniref:glycosyl hydrolase n=1 Tax=Flexithrix dorotheae TaxID=70993 RepID=UPI00036F0C52|nr:glycosyl hydrolase [Flexithrix dorotheae]
MRKINRQNSTKRRDRRLFIKKMGSGMGFLLTGFPTLSCHPETDKNSKSSSDLFFEQFKNPEAVAKPFMRWWWNGNRIDKAEIKRELQVMAKAGVGGIEINPIGFPEQAESSNVPEMDWLSDEWNEILKFTCEEAQKLGMVTDLIVGTGWPFGGKFLIPEETLQGIELEVFSVKGPSKHKALLPEENNPSEKLFDLKLFPQNIKSIEDGISPQILESKGEHSEIEIPAGEFKLYKLTWRNNFRDVMLGAPGGDGPVVDHLNGQAVEKYLHHMSDKLKPVFGGNIGKYVRSLFCDSIELEGANWTDDLSQEFEKRNNYKIEPYLPLVLEREGDFDAFNAKVADEVKRARYDYSKLLADLFTERFIIPYHKWCNANGTESRYQAYGHPWLYTDLLDGNLIPDIPEADQWLFNGGWQPYADVDQIRYAIWNKYSSSAGHLKNRSIISTEAMTNTSGVFEASLAYIKQATDMNFVSGINHLVLHGFNYSPPSVAFPGWIRFGTYFSEKNPWWPYFHHWASYTARLSQAFQNAKAISQVAIMGPTPDIWSNYGLDRNPFNLQPWYLHAIWQAFNHNGYCSDYVNATILKDAIVENGKIVYGEMSYEVLLICDVKTLTTNTAQKINELARAGGKIIFIGEKPSQAPGINGKGKNEAVAKAIWEVLEDDFLVKYTPAPSDELQPSQDELLQWALELMGKYDISPGVEISNPDPKLFFIQYQKEGKDLYFFNNASREKTIHFNAQFPFSDKQAGLLNPETGGFSLYPPNGNLNELKISLAPLESKLFVFEKEIKGEKSIEKKTNGEEILQIEGEWHVEFIPVEGAKFSQKLHKLIDFAKDDQLKNFSGQAIYNITFNAEIAEHIFLDLGEVYEISEVKLNGEALGTRWYGDHIYPVHNQLKTGKNTLEIKVTNLLFNYVKSLEGNPVAKYWMERGKARRKRNIEGPFEPLASGLFGPVRIIK